MFIICALKGNNMNEKDRTYVLLLRVFLLSAALAWGVSVLGLILPWPVVVDQLRGLGAQLNEPDIMVRYWLKMAAAVYTLMGCFFAVVAIRPLRYRAIIRPIGLLHLVLAVVLLINGWMLGVGAIPLYVDVGFCLCIGLGILTACSKLSKSRK